MKYTVASYPMAIALALLLGACSGGTATEERRLQPAGVDTSEVVAATPDEPATAGAAAAPAGLSYYARYYRPLQPDDRIGTRSLRAHLNDPDIPEWFKLILTSEGDSLRDDEPSMALLDSLFSTDGLRHPFYFVLYTHALWWADGAVAEPMSHNAYRYATSHPAALLTYFDREKVLTSHDLARWAEALAAEISITEEGRERDALAALEATMKARTPTALHTRLSALVTETGRHLP